MQCFAVSFQYPVFFTSEMLRSDNQTLAQAATRLEPERRHRVFAAIDGGLALATPQISAELAAYVEHRSATLELAAEPTIIAGGEGVKNSDGVVETLHRSMVAAHLDRQSLVLAIGGGAALDVIGYAAATVHRGVRLIRIPTTVEAQCDSGVGVKNGINAFGVKNLLGTFAPPFAVINDDAFLSTLPERDRRSGSAEAVKVALIRDGEFFEWLTENVAALRAFDGDVTRAMIRRSAELHLEHIASCDDPFEFGSAKPLDFGHWSAHKLESMSGYRLRHGEAVAIGVALDSRYSVEAGLLGEHECTRVCALLESLGFHLWDSTLASGAVDTRPEVLDGLAEFREHLGGELSLTLLEGIGRSIDASGIDEDRMRRAIDWLSRRHSNR